MKSKISLFLTVLSLSLFFSALSSNAQAQNSQFDNRQTKAVAAPEINFTVGMSKPWTHLLEVEMRLRGNLGGQTEIVMPVWTPGSYLIREYARHVMNFSAKNASGQTLDWTKINKNTWQINTGGANEIVVNYNVYANELTVRTNELNDEHAFFTPAAVLMYPKNFVGAPSTIKINPYGNWKVATGLEPLRQPNTFRAVNFDILYDSPFEVGSFTEINFDVRGIPHRMIFEGEGNYDLQRLKQDVPKIVEEAAKIFGELPYKNYLFITNLRGGGGLEHLNSTALQFPRFGFTGQGYNGYLGLVAHEYFHLFNVKRIRPDALGPFDYNEENYTRNLWVAEGGTDYFSNVLLRRAGLISDKEFLAGMAGGIATLQRQPARFEQSAEESSFDAWIKEYRPDENTVNRNISYYNKGEILMMLLDATIRQKTNGAKSADDTMRALYNDFYKQNRNYTPQDFQRVAESIAGTSLDDFFRRYVRGREEIKYNEIFEPLGIRLETGAPNAKQTAYLGANFSRQPDSLVISALPEGTPAYEGGLNANDQLLAIDGYKIASQNELNARLADKKPGDKARFTLYRNDRLRDIEITLGGRAPEQYRFVTVQNASDAQRRLYQGWLGAELK